MKRRSIVGVILLPFVTLGIYVLYWFVSTKRELNRKGASIPTAWLLIIPLVNIWWLWKYFEGAEHVSEGKINGVLVFLLDIFVTSLVSMIICQLEYNKMDASVVIADGNITADSSTQQLAQELPAEQPPQTPPTIPTV